MQTRCMTRPFLNETNDFTRNTRNPQDAITQKGLPSSTASTITSPIKDCRRQLKIARLSNTNSQKQLVDPREETKRFDDDYFKKEHECAEGVPFAAR
jgi:hypothetical protein